MIFRKKFWLFLVALNLAACNQLPDDAPNFLLVISDDQSWQHTSMAGAIGLSTPNFDRVARNGVYFPQAYASAPSCTASRSAILAGQDFWRLGSAAVLNGRFQQSMLSYQRTLKSAGYHTGFTGKGWGPGLADGESPVGDAYNDEKASPASIHVSSIDYAENFKRFLEANPEDRPFSFMLTPFEPHRPFAGGSASESDIEPAQIVVPDFLPDTSEVRNDLADYYFEIQQQDKALGEILDILESTGRIDNTIVVVTSDNGMPFPRAKSTNYEYGVRVPLAISWPAKITRGEINNAIVNLTDLAPTFLAAASQQIPTEVTGRNLLGILGVEGMDGQGPDFKQTVTGFERHIPDARTDNRSYPIRALHTEDAVYIKNYAASRWPVGEPPRYADIDSTSPSKRVVLGMPEYLQFAGGKRPAEELYILADDPYQLNNLANSDQFTELKERLSQQLLTYLRETGDPILDEGVDAFSDFPSY